MTIMTILLLLAAFILAIYLFENTKKKISNFFKTFQETNLQLQKEQELENLKNAAALLEETKILITSKTFNLKALLEIASIKELEIFNTAIAQMEQATANLRKEYNDNLTEIYKNTNLKIASSDKSAASNNLNTAQMIESIAKSMNLSANDFTAKLQAKNITAQQFTAMSKDERRAITEQIKNS